MLVLRYMARYLVVVVAFLSLFFALSPQVYADDPACDYTKEVKTDFGCFPNDPAGFVKKFYGIGLGFVGGISLLTLIIGGYDIIMSRGQPARVNIGKSYIYYSIAGLLLAIFGYVFIQAVLVDILHVPGFK